MAIFRAIAIAIVLLVASILIYSATKPDNFRVERSISIAAAPSKIFPLINDLPKHQLWSPYEKMDPAMKRTYSGTANGIGSIYEWEGNGNAGKGRMEIIDSIPSSLVKIQLNFIKPFEAQNTAEFTLVPNGKSTTVTWAMYGPMPYVSKLMTTFFSMDKMIGDQFEEGLKNLKYPAEKQDSAQ
jgi:hypothetical protein